jgi:hypothetical protein
VLSQKLEVDFALHSLINVFDQKRMTALGIAVALHPTELNGSFGPGHDGARRSA